MGVTIHSGDREFRVPDHYPLNRGGLPTSTKMASSTSASRASAGTQTWTMAAATRKLPLMIMADNLKFSKHKEIKGKAAYDRYDNFDAIEVPFTDAIPSDYDGAMGVPITFLDKYNPEQFEILGITTSTFGGSCKKYPKQVQVGNDGKRSEVTKLNDAPAIKVNMPPIGRTHYIVNGEYFVLSYHRILIRRRSARPTKGGEK